MHQYYYMKLLFILGIAYALYKIFKKSIKGFLSNLNDTQRGFIFIALVIGIGILIDHYVGVWLPSS
jgi:hypothetical protein